MSKIIKTFLSVIITTVISFNFFTTSFAHDGGAGLIWISSPYKGHDDIILPYPAFNIETNHIYIRQLELGVFLYKDDTGDTELSLGLTPGLTMFDPSKTSNAQLSVLSKRKMAIDAYIQFIKRFEYGTIGAKAFFDVLGNAEGFGVDAYYKLPIFINQLTLTPGVGLNFLSADRTNYYYGVSGNESYYSGLRYYAPDYSITPYVSLEASLMLQSGMTLFANLQYNFYSDEIKNSPMVEDENGFTFTAGAMFSF